MTPPLHESVEVFYEFDELKGEGYRTLRALRDFHQGEYLFDLPQVLMSSPDMYSLEVIPGVHVDCSSSPAGAMNHSCDPNAAVRKGAIIAWSCIKAGDEIKLDYQRTEQKLAAPFDCNCGSKNCRGRIE